MADRDKIDTRPLLERIAAALERISPAPPGAPDFAAADAFVWQAEPGAFLPVPAVNRVPLKLLRGIDRMRDLLLENTERFARAVCQCKITAVPWKIGCDFF